MNNKNDKKTTEAVVLVSEATPENLLILAVKQGANVEQLEKLLDLQERMQKQTSKKAYYLAMSEFQDICPPLKKFGKVDYKAKSGDRVKYNFSELDYIAQQIKAPMRKCGFSYRWESEDVEGGKIKITCIVTHIEGHSERNSMTAPKDDSGKKNALQSIGSTRSYEHRYTLIGVFGLTTAGEDNDGQTIEKTFTDLKKEITNELINAKTDNEIKKVSNSYKQFFDNKDFQELVIDYREKLKNKAFDQSQKEEFVKQAIDGSAKEEMKAVLKENPEIMTNENLKKLYNKKLDEFKPKNKLDL